MILKTLADYEREIARVKAAIESVEERKRGRGNDKEAIHQVTNVAR